ncbi:DNA repair exonuclease [Pontibacillus yanchengensis]|nr:DNA repair exonuclease [Pontibacillus yanchengensis]
MRLNREELLCMKGSIRFLHCADLHIDSPFKGYYYLPGPLFRDVRESTFKAFDRLINHAIEQQVDFVLMAGDIFDQDGRSLKAQLHFKKGLERLAECRIHTYVSHGNHDYMNATFYPMTYPEYVHVFETEEVKSFPFYKNGEKLADIHGFSYEQRAVHHSKHQDFTPSSEGIYNIGMLHGSLSTNTEHDVYAPFSIEQLLQRGMDYWALGHIHKKQVLHKDPYIVYPGNIQGRHRNEQGEKGCYIVDLSENTTSLTFCPTENIQFNVETFQVEEQTNLHDLETTVQSLKDDKRMECGKAFIEVTFQGSLPFPKGQEQSMIDELKDIWNEQEEEAADWIWISRVHTSITPNWDREQLSNGAHFIGELIRQFDNHQDIEDHLHELLYHKHMRKYLQPFSEEEKQDLLNRAEQLLLQKLLKGE